MKEKLLLIQKEIGAIKRDATNPFFKSKYFDINSLLAEVKPILNKHRVVLLQGLTSEGGKLALETTLLDVDSRDDIKYLCPLPEGSDAQKTGSAITYFRRYALQSLLALEAEDDDANGIAQPAQKNATTGRINAQKPNSVPYPKGNDGEIPF